MVITAIGRGRGPRYSLQKEGAIVIGGTAVGRTVSQVEREFNALAARRPDLDARLVKVKISAAEGDHWSDAEWAERAERLLRYLGYGRCLYMIVRHTDTGRDHVHAEVLPITIDGHVVDRSNDYYRVQLIEREIEITDDLRPVPFSWESEGHQYNRADVRRVRDGEAPFFVVAGERAGDALESSANWGELTARLHAVGFTLSRRGAGLVITDGEATAALGEVDAAYSMPKLEQRFQERYDDAERREFRSPDLPLEGRGAEEEDRCRGGQGVAGRPPGPLLGPQAHPTDRERAWGDLAATDTGRGDTAGARGLTGGRSGERAAVEGDPEFGGGRRDTDRPDVAGAQASGGPDSRPGEQLEPLLLEHGLETGGSDLDGIDRRGDPGAATALAGVDTLAGATGGSSDRGLVPDRREQDVEGGAEATRGDDRRREQADTSSIAERLRANLGLLIEAEATQRGYRAALVARDRLKQHCREAAGAPDQRDRASENLDAVLRAHTGLPGRIRQHIDQLRSTRSDEAALQLVARHDPAVGQALQALIQAERRQLLPSELLALNTEIERRESAIRLLDPATGSGLPALRKAIRTGWEALSADERAQLSPAERSAAEEITRGRGGRSFTPSR